jgi:hypothetical protein
MFLRNVGSYKIYTASHSDYYCPEFCSYKEVWNIFPLVTEQGLAKKTGGRSEGNRNHIFLHSV